jgi:hypothetical protein
MNQWIKKEDLISQHDTLKKSVRRSYIQNKLIFELGANLFSGVCKVQTGILPDFTTLKLKEIKKV